MYTWGYIKENTLSKLNLTEEEANQQNFLSYFPYYANEAMTQICSSIKPRNKYFKVEVYDKETAWYNCTRKHGIYTQYLHPIEDDYFADDVDYEKKKAFWTEWNSLYFVDEPITMPDDFISFSSDEYKYKSASYHNAYVDEELLEQYGYNQIRCKMAGTYEIPYNARWFFFTKELQNYVEIPAPLDVCDAIPSYIASQCLKIDDEVKAAIFRNEYEIFLARIDDSSYDCDTIKIGGDW